MRDKLKKDIFDSVKRHDQPRVDVLRYLISLIDKKSLQLPPGEMTEQDEVTVIRKELKNKEEAREMFLSGKRDDLVSQLDYEMSVVKEYLPVEMSDEELNSIIDEVIVTCGNNFGLVMKTVLIKVAGKVGGDRIVPIVKDKITNN